MPDSIPVLAPGEAIREHLLDQRKIAGEIRKRLATHLTKTVAKGAVAEYEEEGWIVDRPLKTRLRMRKEKPHDQAFEDRVWATFARLQFTHLNRDRTFVLAYGPAPSERQQIDVFAADDEVVLVVECKSTQTIHPGQFKKEIEAIAGQRGGIIRRIREEYPDRKVKFILATNNYTVSQSVSERISGAEIAHFTEDTIDYYLRLAEHLGSAAKYQLLGALFAGTKIPNLEPTVAAFRGSMGGHQYYSFAIEPARLLKMCYILHRNQANSALMPTYQRLIKKSRLKRVSEFVDEGGFFPNSIILNIETKRSLQFDLAPNAAGPVKLGVLHLPQTYRAAYVIDGQHRLYGYANSDRSDTDLIPVVAFLDLPREEQVQLFMQINENQQAVPKNLRNTLNSDLLWESDNLQQRAKALRLRVAQHLGDQKTSPLFDRVIIGENVRSFTRCITIDAIDNGLTRGNFIGKFTKSAAKEVGIFYAGNNQATADLLIPFLEETFQTLSEGLDAQWKLGSAEGGFVFINSGIEALLRILSDIVQDIASKQGLSPLTASTSELSDACQKYFDPLIDHLSNLSLEEGIDYRKSYGSGGGMRYYRKLQLALSEAMPDFEPPGLTEWLKAQDEQFTKDAFGIVNALEAALKSDIRQRLEDEFGSDWEREGIPRKVRKKTADAATDRNLDLAQNEQVDAWDMMNVVDYYEVLVASHKLWQDRFGEKYTRPQDEDLSKWKERAEWVKRLSPIRNALAHARGISEDDYVFLVELREWFLASGPESSL
jgi:DNA sulfur modification protein DndB